MATATCNKDGIDECILGRPIHFDLGVVQVEPEVTQFLIAHGTPVEVLLAKHERLIPSEAMEATDHYQNLAAAPKKRMVLSVYRVGERLIWIETADGHTQTHVQSGHSLEDLLPPAATSLKDCFHNLFH